MGNELSRVYDRIGDLSELDEAIDTYETVVQIDPTKSNLHGHILNALGGALRERYGRTGRVSDLEQAISNFRQAIQITPSNWVERCGRLNNLGNALRDLYAYTRDLSDITEAIDFCEQALQLTPMDSPIYPRHLTNFGLALEDCCNDKKDISYLKRAILSFEEAIQATALDSPERVDRLNSLGNGFSTLYSYTDNQDDLNRALGAFEEALNFALPESEERARTLNNSTAVLEKLYNRTNDITKLSQAIARIEEAIQITPKNSIQLARRLNNLANLLILRFAQIGDQTDKERAVESWRQACQVGLDVSMEIVLTASSSWLDAILSYHHWQEAIEASKYALQATEHLFRVQLLRTSKEAWLKEASGLHAKAAYALSRQGDFPSALLTLEGGRARLLADIIERQRSDLKKLKEMGYEDVYDLYSSTTQKLGVLENAEISEKDSPKHIDLRTEIFNARADLDKAIELIRKIDGYEDFFKSSTFERVKHDLLDKETSAGIYLLTTSIGGLGLIVHSNGVEAVWLEDFGESDLDALLIKSEEGKPTGGYLLGQFGYGSFEALNELLPVLGEQAIAPIAERLRQIGITKIVLIPTGRLALLPLHAAQYNHKGSDMCLLDEFEVTYAASARVLGIARQKLTSQQNTPPVLTGVGNPLKNPRPLTYARPELEEIGNFFANDARYLFFEQDATKEALFTASSNAKYIHFSCHGMFDLFNPLSSHLQLAKGDTLTLREVMNSKKFENARLVVLSACQTAITDFNKLPDETIGLPMGFFQAGVPGVVGTLWPVDDLSTMLLMIKLYEKHIREGKAPVVSLCEAQLWLRRVTNTELSKLFAEYKAGALNHASTRIAYELAREKFREHTLGNPNERPYEHPYFWAPFVFYGT